MYKNVKVADVLSHTPLNIRSKHVLRDDRRESWLHSVEHLMGVHLNEEVGRFSWTSTTSRIFFLVKSLYGDYISDHTNF
jgi:hypothetical protein